jgi:multidrug efflux pump subunit AcrA (membrane-fusion protein)
MQVREQAVTVVRPEGDDLVIGSGLKTGDVVVTAGAHVLTSGQRVALWQEPNVH